MKNLRAIIEKNPDTEFVVMTHNKDEYEAFRDIVLDMFGHCDMSGCDFMPCDIRDIYVINVINFPNIPMTCPEKGSFTAWKKAGGCIVKLQIPEDARRSSATGRKCRCDKAFVVAIENIDGTPSKMQKVTSDYDDNFVYYVGETVTEPTFCNDRFRECASGIHFFMTRQEAVDY